MTLAPPTRSAPQAGTAPADAATGEWTLRRAAIIGAGAMGSSLAAVLGRSVPVVMVCRNPERASAIFRSGVRTTGLIESRAEPIVVRSVKDLASIGGVSAVFITTKTTAIPQVAAELRSQLDRIGDQPAAPFIISYQNGIEPGRHLIEALGDDRVLRMVLSLGAVMDPRGQSVAITLSTPPHAIGCLRPDYRPVCEQLAGALSAAGLHTVFDPQIERRVWTKGLINAAANPVAALVNASIGQVLDSPAAAIVRRLLDEGLAVARAEGLDLGDDFPARAWAVLEAGRHHIPSMVEDIRAGRESEVGELNRQVLEHARRRGVPTPTHEVIDALIETFDWKVYSARPSAPASPR